jgi:hypothetical protein
MHVNAPNFEELQKAHRFLLKAELIIQDEAFYGYTDSLMLP